MELITVIPFHHFTSLSAMFFGIGMLSLVARRGNIISILISIELMLLGVNINFISTSAYGQNISGQIFTFFILCVAAAEVAVGLAILIAYFKSRGNIDVGHVNMLMDK
jgi:NADH-quinone oxidoreductase subunit K